MVLIAPCSEFLDKVKKCYGVFNAKIDFQSPYGIFICSWRWEQAMKYL